MTFRPFEFIANLKYMGIGMLSILIVIGVIMLVTIILNQTSKNKD
ncbi:MAG TPA: oxaloacetate decarboxylase [Clostridiales bacterium]|nr:oxaloacetate decarboxylase [Clostridiales bacterium]HBL82247.1 oxaloacetate decarboxylase [Clostridiales bacterium]